MGTVVEPLNPGAVCAQETDQLLLVAGSPRAARGADRTLIRAQRFGSRKLVEAPLARQQLEGSTQQRRVVLACDQVAVAVRRTARANQRDVRFGEAVARE